MVCSYPLLDSFRLKKRSASFQCHRSPFASVASPRPDRFSPFDPLSRVTNRNSPLPRITPVPSGTRGHVAGSTRRVTGSLACDAPLLAAVLPMPPDARALGPVVPRASPEQAAAAAPSEIAKKPPKIDAFVRMVVTPP